jgi:hypothetical protein
VCAQHVGVGAGVHFLSALFGSLPRCLFTVALGGDIAAAAMAPSIDQLPSSSVARLVVGALSLLAPIALRQYCHTKTTSVASYSDLYDTDAAPAAAATATGGNGDGDGSHGVAGTSGDGSGQARDSKKRK